MQGLWSILVYIVTMETELQLLKAIQSGQQDAQRQLYERYAGQAMATGMRYVPDPDQVRDVVHDSFVKILTSLDQFNYRGEGSLRAWIKSIVAHQAINHIKQYEHLKLTDQFPESMVQESEDPDVDRVPRDILNKLISELPAGYRIVLNLYVFEQKSHKEIAHLLGIKPETSASQFSRAKQALAKRINEYLNNSKL